MLQINLSVNRITCAQKCADVVSKKWLIFIIPDMGPRYQGGQKN